MWSAILVTNGATFSSIEVPLYFEVPSGTNNLKESTSRKSYAAVLNSVLQRTSKYRTCRYNTSSSPDVAFKCLADIVVASTESCFASAIRDLHGTQVSGLLKYPDLGT